MPPGNICAAVGCNSKEKEENVTSFTLPNGSNKHANGKQANDDASTAANTQTTKQPSSETVTSITQRNETSLTVPDPKIEPLTLDIKPKKEPIVEVLARTITEPSLEIDDEIDDDSFNKMPLQMTKPAPQFKTTAVVNGEFKDISLSDYEGKYVVLFFYPLDFTFVCPTEIIAFSERADDFRKIGCEVIAASTDSHFTHLAWINTPRKQGGLGPMNIPILADKSHRIARDYGVLDEETGIPFRGLFIIDDNQRLRQITVNDLPVGRSVEETLRLVQAFQYTDKYGEVCPANWTPGSKTIKPEPKAAKEYFGDTH